MKMTGDQTNEDSDVAEERMRVMSEDTEEDVVVLRDLYKRQGALVTVDHLCVGVLEQECFGLLGQKGAGKTTTLKMLTGDVMVSGGDALICGHSIIQHAKEVHAKLGYCPQIDALIDQMTGRETLTMYARLKGVPARHIERIVKNLLDIFLLRRHADKFISYYSVGNKRKLSTAIALIGNPPVLLLDEPTTGMDPGSRRQLWNVLSRVQACGKTVVLTSNSVEECEALCTRIAIMVNGHIKCIGSPNHLQSKFGHGYTLIIKMATLDPGIFASSQPVIDFIIKKFPGSLKFDAHEGFVHFQVPSSKLLLSTLFTYMEEAKQNLNVQEYSVHQTTLEQVFLAFTRTQNQQRELMNWSTSFTPSQCLR